MTLTPLDYAMILVPLTITTAITVVLARHMRGVAGFLAADRSAGRYLISSATGELAAGVVGLLAILELFSRAGLSLRFWFSLTEVVLFLFGLLGIIVYRFRQTRSLTFHQFFERRYSKGVRVFASLLNVMSGVLAFGIAPAVGSRFFVYFCGMPETLRLAGIGVPTFAVVMVVLMAVSLYFTISGGQLSILVNDCLEGVLSTFYYLIIGLFVITTISVTQMHDVLTSGPAGGSYVDPLDIGTRGDFNFTYVLLAMGLYIYQYRGTAWQQGFAASAKSAHEGRMASILGTWRGYCTTAITLLVGLAALTVLNHPAYADQRLTVDATLAGLPSEQLRTQMRMPTALGVLLPSGIKGALCAVLLFGLLSVQGAQLHNYGSTLLQDVVLPLRRKPFTPDGHVRALRLTITGVAVFVCIFSYFFKPVDYLIMLTGLISAIYLAGIGAVVWGGLYWRRGTTAGAWAALGSGAGLGIGFNIVTQAWPHVAPALARAAGPGSLGDYLSAHTERFPVNGQMLAVVTAVVSASLYVIVSLLSRRAPFDLDAMLHRDAPAPETNVDEALPQQRSWLDRFLNITPEFTRGDRLLAKFTFGWTMTLKAFAFGVLLWTLLVARPSEDFWFGYSMVTGVWLALAIAAVVTVWFTIGAARDLLALLRALRSARPDAGDDGTETPSTPPHMDRSADEIPTPATAPAGVPTA